MKYFAYVTVGFLVPAAQVRAQGDGYLSKRSVRQPPTVLLAGPKEPFDQVLEPGLLDEPAERDALERQAVELAALPERLDRQPLISTLELVDEAQGAVVKCRVQCPNSEADAFLQLIDRLAAVEAGPGERPGVGGTARG